MYTITTTELRTKSKDLVKALKSGRKLRLIHRSRTIGEIKPLQDSLSFTPSELASFFIKIRPEKIISKKDRDALYRSRLESKYGKSIPRR